MAKRWKDEIAVGRVFEIKRKTFQSEQVCVLIVRPRRGNYNPNMCVQVDRTGVVKGTGESWNRARSGVYTLDERSLPGLIIRRRADLERFDERDLDLIRYGQTVDYTGRIGTAYGDGLPGVGPATWTIFWTKGYNFGLPLLREARRELKELFSGEWHFESHRGGDWRYGRDSVMHAWGTAKTDRRVLRRIEAILANGYSHLERCTVTVADRMIGGARVTYPIGDPGPAVADTGWIQIEWPESQTNSLIGHSVQYRGQWA